MKRTTSMAWVVVILIAGCAAESVAPGPASTVPRPSGVIDVGWDESLTVRAGDVVRVPWSSLDVTVLDINDSRCPATPDNGIACVWEGNIVTTLRFDSDEGASVERSLEGILEAGEPMYGTSPSAEFDLVQVYAVGIDDEGSITLMFGGMD